MNAGKPEDREDQGDESEKKGTGEKPKKGRGKSGDEK